MKIVSKTSSTWQQVLQIKDVLKSIVDKHNKHAPVANRRDEVLAQLQWEKVT